ncbi:alpha/beta fold hydrolase [Halopiger xanaduensis]|uniref:Alpha/beta hydrolase fold protein n=1 Tax=Halopiger xanaduensis (strain DSM 18323 / JCM 14033 / SH-6) TaxID=797210 RepID=F8D6N7_HALXS|nr:alpha/beta hydrolase [Halopiger xanaduensis]AEH37777.1 alpha/beta hydrolase fold protein [Halopiger xanaduensis SH-6]
MDLPEEWTAGTVSANGIDHQYYRTGEGPPVVLAHGMYDNGRRWVRLGSELADDYEVIAYDARGHGRTDAPETGYDMTNRVADLVGIVDELGLPNPVLVGHSMGAATVACAAADHPDLPRALVLEAPARFREAPQMDMETARERSRKLVREAQDLSLEERIDQHYDDVDAEPEQIRRLAVATGECSPRVAMYAQEHRLVVETFDEITCPTLSLRPDLDVADRTSDLNAAERLASERLVHVPDAGHYVFRDAYDAALAELRTFLRRA